MLVFWGRRGFWRFYKVWAAVIYKSVSPPLVEIWIHVAELCPLKKVGDRTPPFDFEVLIILVSKVLSLLRLSRVLDVLKKVREVVRRKSPYFHPIRNHSTKLWPNSNIWRSCSHPPLISRYFEIRRWWYTEWKPQRQVREPPGNNVHQVSSRSDFMVPNSGKKMQGERGTRLTQSGVRLWICMRTRRSPHYHGFWWKLMQIVPTSLPELSNPREPKQTTG